MRLVDEAAVANWVTGHLQVFFEGSWSQVCGGPFAAPDVNVVCRQLGYGAGTVMPQVPIRPEAAALNSTSVLPEVAITTSGCTGLEQRIMDCAADANATAAISRDCVGSTGTGLVVGCVAAQQDGVLHAQKSNDECLVVALPYFCIVYEASNAPHNANPGTSALCSVGGPSL